MHKRAILIVLDSLGVGALPDAAAYGDEGSHTLQSVLSACPGIRLPNLKGLGLLNIEGLSHGVPMPLASYGRLQELSPGKDTATGHWEMAGLQLAAPFPTFPNGFPAEFIAELERAIGRKVLGNVVASGLAVIEKFGQEHLRTGQPIVYTSADSVLQIAAHEEIIKPEELYAICRRARELLKGPLAVGRVIARPFVGAPGQFSRTGRRHDFSLQPFGETLLDRLYSAGCEVVAVGKIGDLFAGRGVSRSIPTGGNEDGIRVLLEEAKKPFTGLLFVNLVDFDMLYGHRRDPIGYGAALEAFDRCLPELISALGEEDLLLITGDHGCDPCFLGTDHTREYVPLLALKRGSPPRPLGTLRGFGHVSAMILSHLGL
ncbi:MAG: phosphopentomutase [Christensenellaceae bacterium]|jgi:phosphopentomutase|nr:phosphopentomutase [Christensenellaceae bacterium]